MSSLKDLLKKALGGRTPEVALAEFKEKMHHAINHFHQDPASQTQVKQYLSSILRPLNYFNMFVVRPHMANPDKLKALAHKYRMNKIELKRFFKIALELEERLKRYFGDDLNFDQLVITLRKVINVLDEQLLVDLIDAIDYNIDFGKIEKAYLTYQDSLQKAYNTEGLKHDLQSVIGSFMSSFKRSLDPNKTSYRASDKAPETRMLPPNLQNTYDHYREEGYTHEEAMAFVKEKEETDALTEAELVEYRTLRESGKDHRQAIIALQVAQKSASQDTDAD